MDKVFYKFITTIIEETFGFTPIVDIIILPGRTIQVTLDGTPIQRKEMMGRDAKNFQTMKYMLRVFARRNGCFSYLYIKPPHENYPTILERPDIY